MHSLQLVSRTVQLLENVLAYDISERLREPQPQLETPAPAFAASADSELSAEPIAAELARLGYDGPSWACWLCLRFAVTALSSAVGVLEHVVRRAGEWRAVAEQLSDPRTFAALAGAARFFQERLWPQAEAAGLGEDEPTAAAENQGDADATGPSNFYKVTGQGQVLCHSLSPMELSGLVGPAQQGSLLLTDLQQTVFGLLRCCQVPARGQGRRESASSALHAATCQHLAGRMDAALRESGMLEALLAAFLAAPLPPPVSREATQLSRYTERLILAETAYIMAPDSLHKSLGTGLGDTAVMRHLTQPQALRLRRTVLEQAAMWRPEPPVAGRAGAGAAGGTAGLSTDASGPPSYPDPEPLEAAAPAAMAASAAATGPLWPILQSRALRLSLGPTLQITETLKLMVGCAAGGSLSVLSTGLADSSGPDDDPAGLYLALPDLPSAVETLAGAAEALGRRAEALAALGVPQREPKPFLLDAVLWLQMMASYRLKHVGHGAQLSACLPVVLRLQGWLIRATANRLVLAGCQLTRLTTLLRFLGLYVNDGFRGDAARAGVSVWSELTPAQRAAAQDALHASGWAPALDRAQWWQRGREQRQQASSSDRGASAEGEDRAGVEARGGDQAPPLRPWPAQEALGLLVTLAKLARREAARMVDAMGAGAGSPAAAGLPQLLLGPKSPVFNLAASMCAARSIGDEGWAALAELGPGADAADAAVLAESRRRLGEVVDWCGVAAIQLAAALAADAAAALRLHRTSPGAAGGWTPPPMAQTLKHAACLGQLVRSLACCCSPAALEAAAPQRALLALVAVAAATCRAQGAGADADFKPACAGLNRHVIDTVIVLSSDQRLRHLVPGWYWPGPPRPDVDGCFPTWNMGVLSEDGGRAAVSGALPRCPIVATQSPGGAALANARWPDDLDRLGPLVMAAARRDAMERRVFGPGGRQRQWAAAFGDRGGGGGSSWPPAALRVCGYPHCDALGAGAECALPLKQCAGCRGVRYCCVGCQQAHWRGGHKAECGRAGAAAEQAS